MLTPQVTLFRFCKVILIGIATAILFASITLALKPLVASLAFSEGLSTFVIALATMIVTVIINSLDLFATSLISKSEYQFKRRSLWASTLNHVLFGVFLLPWLGIVIVRQIDSVTVWFLIAAYAIAMRVANGFWETIYSTSPTRTLKVYGEVGALLSLFIGAMYFADLFTVSQESQIAVIVVAWLLLEFIWEHVIGLIYYGFNQFYGVTFMHDFTPVKNPQPGAEATAEDNELMQEQRSESIE